MASGISRGCSEPSIRFSLSGGGDSDRKLNISGDALGSFTVSAITWIKGSPTCLGASASDILDDVTWASLLPPKGENLGGPLDLT